MTRLGLATVISAAIAATSHAQQDVLGEGTYWEFTWVDEQSSFSQGSSSSRWLDFGKFRFTLGNAEMVDGIEMRRLELTGRHHDQLQTHWTHLGVDQADVFYGISGDSGTPVILFNPNGLPWAGSGLLGWFSPSYLMDVNDVYLDNPYLVGDAYRISRSVDDSRCEMVEGRLICGSDDAQSSRTREYWDRNLGPIGFTFSNNYNFCGGGFCSGGSSDQEIWLLSTSFWQQEPAQALEVEPNPWQEPMRLPTDYEFLIGWISTKDEDVEVLYHEITEIRVHDTYEVEISSAGTVELTLAWRADSGADLDLWLIDQNGSLHGLSQSNINNNESLGEFISEDLPVGRYRVLVAAPFLPGSDTVEYWLGSELPAPVFPVEFLDGEPIHLSRIQARNGQIIEAAMAQIFRQYLGGLGRQPAAGGYRFWWDRIDDGRLTFVKAAQQFIDSPEFVAKADADGDSIISNAEFVDHMYFNVFGRAPAEGGRNFWINSIDRSSQSVAFNNMLQSAEFVAKTLATVGEWPHWDDVE